MTAAVTAEMVQVVPLPPMLLRPALNAQDRIGWQDYTDPAGTANAVLGLARVVVTLARKVEALRVQVALAARLTEGDS